MNAPNEGRRHGTPTPPGYEPIDAGFRAGLWLAFCLFLASTAPAPLLVPVLGDLLMVAAFASGIGGLVRGASPRASRFNDLDVAAGLMGCALIAGLFVDPVHLAEQLTALEAGAAGTAG